MRCLAVATGSAPAATLALAGADWVVDDLGAGLGAAPVLAS
jgi:phosphoglycolate phosphatase-like HAD superfamily hydrolase